MIATKEKNKSPKDSMTLLPCFYFVEVRGAGGVVPVGAGRRPGFHTPSGGLCGSRTGVGTARVPGCGGSEESGCAGGVGVREAQPRVPG